MLFQPPHADEKELVDALKHAGFFTTNVQMALSYAKRAHQNQKRDFGAPYLEEHIYPIVLNILNHNENDPALEDVLTLGILHDVFYTSPQNSDNLLRYKIWGISNALIHPALRPKLLWI